MAEEKKLEGNNEYTKGNYQAAVRLYTEAIGRHALYLPVVKWTSKSVVES